MYKYLHISQHFMIYSNLVFCMIYFHVSNSALFLPNAIALSFFIDVVSTLSNRPFPLNKQINDFRINKFSLRPMLCQDFTNLIWFCFRITLYSWFINSIVEFCVKKSRVWKIVNLQLKSVWCNCLFMPWIYYRKTSNISRTLVGNKIVDNSDVVGASPVGAAPTTSSFST